MQRFFHCFFCLPIAVGLMMRCSAQERRNEPQPGEIAGVRQAAEAYIAALRRGDTARLIESWTADGEFIDSGGRIIKGRDLARQNSLPSPQNDGGNLAISIDSIRFITPDVALEVGTTELPGATDKFAVARYSAIWVKRDGKWLLDSVLESAPHEGSHHDRLRPLNWLVGDRVQRDGTGGVELTCRWSSDGNYLLREMKGRDSTGQMLSVSQRIGWDPSTKQITAWTFDSDGGHAMGVWSRQGDKWLVRSSGVLPDGQTRSSASTYVRTGDNAFTWESTQGGGAGLPATQRKVELVRRNSFDKSGSLVQP